MFCNELPFASVYDQVLFDFFIPTDSNDYRIYTSIDFLFTHDT